MTTPLRVAAVQMRSGTEAEPNLAALEAFVAEAAGQGAELLVFPDENHWVLTGANSVQWHRTVFDWMGKHVKK